MRKPAVGNQSHHTVHLEIDALIDIAVLGLRPPFDNTAVLGHDLAMRKTGCANKTAKIDIEVSKAFASAPGSIVQLKYSSASGTRQSVHTPHLKIVAHSDSVVDHYPVAFHIAVCRRTNAAVPIIPTELAKW
ncbi:hypothetical protein NP233_g6367 [Leucocoprinus birnbaumii]|uniref:Uncharacterized protein n=1 Tax=Leucocoprinus birnbaumii TaxID=56174 RepID=A0AAD5VR49_9AGAR|nr:hypothetical protein NP233_g6367 [Leucocoprinus birnbaumii]